MSSDKEIFYAILVVAVIILGYWYYKKSQAASTTAAAASSTSGFRMRRSGMRPVRARRSGMRRRGGMRARRRSGFSGDEMNWPTAGSLETDSTYPYANLSGYDVSNTYAPQF
jgi:hypothetical protein